MYKQLLTEVEMKSLKTGKQIEDKTEEHPKSLNFLLKILGLMVLFYGAYLCSVEVFGPASRRLCNFSFVLYHTACVLAGCSMAILMELTHSPREINMVEDAINWNQF